MTNPTTFADLGLSPEILRALDELGYEEPTPIQAETIPHLLAGNDLLGQAATGTGKTAAFALPMLQRVNTEGRAVPQALVLVPTRELAMQVCEAVYRYGRHMGVRAVPVFGGQPIFRQLQALDGGVHVVVATPGRALDHIGRGSLALDDITTVILDEADEMLDMGFADDIESILESTPPTRQTVLFSATMPPRINSIANRFQREPVRIQIQRSDQRAGTAAKIRQVLYVVQRNHKPAALGRILDIEAPGAALVFCRTRTEVDELTETMNARGYRAEALHGGMDQAGRDRVMGRLRDGTAELLVATDVAARGLDVDTLTHVVNYDVPSAPESYVHRIGRVGRAGREGVAITLAEPREQRLIDNIERLTRQHFAVERVPSIADLRAKQVEHTVMAVREAMSAEDLDNYNTILNALEGDGNPRQIALAALKLAHDASSGTVDEAEIPDVSHRLARSSQGGGKDDRRGGTNRTTPPWERNGKGRDDRFGGKSDRFDRFDRDRNNDRSNDRGQERDRDQRGPAARHGRNDERDQTPRNRAERRGGGQDETAFIYVAVGRKGNLRPGDLVGAIANETDLSGRQIGPIKITDKFSIVGVPAPRANDVIHALNATTIKGQRAKARPYVD
jgi:ATP-dependent RNA helicase DeaD